MPKYPPIINTSAIGLPDAYYKLIKACLEHGALKRRFYGKPVSTFGFESKTNFEDGFKMIIEYYKRLEYTVKTCQN